MVSPRPYSLGSPTFPHPRELCKPAWNTHIFPLLKRRVILWITTHSLCVYRNMQHLSKMNSRRSEDSAEILLLSVSNTLLVPCQPCWDHPSPWKCRQLWKARKLCFCYKSETHNFLFVFFFFLSICSWTVLHSLKALRAQPQGCHSWEIPTPKACGCSQIQHR